MKFWEITFRRGSHIETVRSKYACAMAVCQGFKGMEIICVSYLGEANV